MCVCVCVCVYIYIYIYIGLTRTPRYGTQLTVGTIRVVGVGANAEGGSANRGDHYAPLSVKLTPSLTIPLPPLTT